MRAVYWLGALAAIFLVLVAFTPSPFRTAFSGIGLPFLRARAAAADLSSRHLDRLQPLDTAERTRLKRYETAIIPQLNQLLRNAKNAEKENLEFRMYYELPPPPDWKLTVAPVIARDPATWNRRFRIGKGANDGIFPGAAVMAGNQLIGRVMEVTPNSASVATVADPACRLSVRLAAADTVGILSGRIEQRWHEPTLFAQRSARVGLDEPRFHRASHGDQYPAAVRCGESAGRFRSG